jgi:hypothetical protein
MLSICEPNQYYQVFLSQGVGMGIGMGLVIFSSALCPLAIFLTMPRSSSSRPSPYRPIISKRNDPL